MRTPARQLYSRVARVALVAVVLVLPAGNVRSQTAPVIVQQPQSQTIAEGISLTLEVAATGGVTNGLGPAASGGPAPHTNILDTGASAGTVLIQYDFTFVPDSLSVYYDDTLLFESGLVSGYGTWTVDYGPGASSRIVVVMNRGIGLIGSLWTYTPSVIFGAPHYQWWKDGAPLADATNATLVLSNAQPAGSGFYFATASNFLGVATSDVARVTVTLPTLTIRRLNAWQYQITWPLDYRGYYLRNKSSLGPAPWEPVPEPDLPDATSHRITINHTGHMRFFRLVK